MEPLSDLSADATTDEDPAVLLQEFVSSRRSEAAFARLASSVGGLVYSSARRRTGERHLAEEVTQNVFAVLARKAPSLIHHPSLTAWIYQTTRLESAKAMRAEHRRRRKHEALAKEVNAHAVDTPASDGVWQEALPILDDSLDKLPERDRQLILQRFYEERKFSEIAHRTGRSEAACKMQLKRVLTKLSQVLSARGVALSASAIAAGLTAEFARAAPGTLMTSLSPKALTLSQSISGTIILTNTIQTMSTIKTVSLTSTAILAAASAPLLWQESQAHSIRSELHALTEKRERLESIANRTQETTANQAHAGEPARTVRHLLEAAEGPVDPDTLIQSLAEAMMNQDMVGMIQAVFPITNLSESEFSDLLEGIEAHQGNPQLKEMAMQMIGVLAPEGDPQESLDRMMNLEMEPHAYAKLLSQWAEKDPEAAYLWYNEKLKLGALEGKGIYNSPDQVLFAELIGGMGKKDPVRAIELLAQDYDQETHGHARSRLAYSLGADLLETDDDTHFQAFLDLDLDDDHRFSAVNGVLRNLARTGDFDRGNEFAESYLEERHRTLALVSMVSSNRNKPFSERADWLLNRVSQEDLPNAARQVISRTHWEDPSAIASWLEDQTPGDIRDHGMAEFARSQSRTNRHTDAYQWAERIQDTGLKDKTLESVGKRWLKEQPQDAESRLPRDLVDRLRAESNIAH